MAKKNDRLAGLPDEPANIRSGANKQSSSYMLPPDITLAVKEVTLLMAQRGQKVTQGAVVAHAIRQTYTGLVPSLTTED